MGAVGAVFGSWMNDRAIVYRRKYNIPTEWGTAVNVQAMVYGNTGDDSGSGVAFTRNPANGDEGVLRRVPDQRAGRGRRRRRAHAGAGGRAEEADAEGLRRARAHPRRRSRSTSRTCRTSSSPSQDGKRLHAADAQRQAHRDGRAEVLDRHGQKEKLIDWKTAVMRNPGRSARAAARADVRRRRSRRRRKAIATGLPAGPGAASGKIYLNADRAVTAAEKGEKVLLVRVETSPEDLRGMIAAEGILTARGGVSSHAALVARQMGKVCVCGAAAVRSRLPGADRHGRRPDVQGRRLAVDRRHRRQGLRRPGQDRAVARSSQA